ncbi:MAG: Flp pilus assembly protein CpaB [Lachnospiraceae bacterium]
MKKIRIVAIFCALAVALGLFVMLQKVDKKEEVTVDVVVAVSDIPQNTVLTDEMLEVKAIPEAMVLGGTYGSKEALIGKMAKVDIKTGEQIIADRINEIGDRNAASLAMLVEEGKRAISIAVDSVTGLSGMIHPGDTVDVIAHVEQTTDTEETEQVSVTIVENIPVLAVDNVMSNGGKGDGYSTVTLMVTPEEANVIDWTANKGVLRIVLRTPLDTDPISGNRVNGDAIGIEE